MREENEEIEEKLERKVDAGLETAPIPDAPVAESSAEEPAKEVSGERKEREPRLVLHKFEKAVSKKYEFSGEDLIMYGLGALALVVAAYLYGRLSVEIASDAG